MKRLLSKKGITLVEIIVVIAIIGILTAIVVPLLSNTSSFEKEALENSRAFYSNVQQVLIEEKFKETVLNSTGTKNAKYTLIYAEVKDESGDPSSRIRVSVAYQDDETKITNEFPGFKIAGFDTINEITMSDTLYEFSNSLKKMLAANDYKCYYYAVIDDNYRVASTYFSRFADYDALSGNNFSEDQRISYNSEEFIVGAYPYSLSEKGKPFFRDPNEVHSSVDKNKK